MYKQSQLRRLAVLDHLIAGRLKPRKNVMEEPKFLPGLDSYLNEYFSIAETNPQICSLLLKFGVSEDKKRKIFFLLVWEHARFVENRYIPLSPYTDPEILLFFITASMRNIGYSDIGRMIERYYKENYAPGMLIDLLWRHFERHNYREDHDFDPR